MKQLFQIEEAYTATHGGGDGTAQVSHMRITSSQVPVNKKLGHPFEEVTDEVESSLRYFAGCKKTKAYSPSQAEHVEKVYTSLLAGEVVQTMSGKVQIREV